MRFCVVGLPQLGFVKKKLDVVMYGITSNTEGIKTFKGLSTMDIRRTVWIGLKNTMGSNIVYPIAPEDHIIETLQIGDKKANIFVGGLAIERVFQKVMVMQYMKMLKK